MSINQGILKKTYIHKRFVFTRQHIFIYR